MKNFWFILLILIVLAGGAWMLSKNQSAEMDKNAMMEGDAMENEDSVMMQKAGVYQIVSEESTVSFKIDEILNNKPFTAVGTTSAVSGQISMEGDNLEIGTITIDAKTFKTDNPNRDGAITKFILQSDKDENNFITFAPTKIEKGEGNTYNVTGNMTISGVTREEVLMVDVSKSEGVLSGHVTGKLLRSNYSLKIPNVPFVASVEDSFIIDATIVAKVK